MKTETSAINIDRGKGDFSYPEAHVRDAGAGLSERTIHYIADVKEDPDWVRDFRLRALKTFWEKPLPTHWASKELEAIDFDKIRYYLSPGTETKRSWEEVPDDIKRTFERLGIPEQERKFLAGVEAQFDSEAVYSNIKKAVGEQGVIFVGSTRGAEELSGNFPPLVQQSHSGWRQQIQRAEFSSVQWRLIHLCPARSESEASATGILQDQRGKLWPVRAHPHYRGRGLGSYLHGRLHCAEI